MWHISHKAQTNRGDLFSAIRIPGYICKKTSGYTNTLGADRVVCPQAKRTPDERPILSFCFSNKRFPTYPLGLHRGKQKLNSPWTRSQYDISWRALKNYAFHIFESRGIRAINLYGKGLIKIKQWFEAMWFPPRHETS